MAVIGYFEVFPQKAKTELRVTTVLQDTEGIPAGTYVFREYFCTDLNCNCQRVIIKVLNPKSELDRNPREVATIGYTWSDGENEMWRELNAEVSNPYLDPLHFQAPFADAIMQFWTHMVETDQNYALRLKKHYRELRAEKGTSGRYTSSPASQGFNGTLNREDRRRLSKSRPRKPARR